MLQGWDASRPVNGWRLPLSNSTQTTDRCGVGHLDIWQLLCFRSDVTCTWQLNCWHCYDVLSHTLPKTTGPMSSASAHLTCQTSISCWRRLTINCLREYWTICITHCTSYFHHNLQHRITISSDAAPMTDMQLHEHQGHLSDCNFITRLQYKNSYWLNSIYVNEIFTVQTISFIYKLTCIIISSVVCQMS